MNSEPHLRLRRTMVDPKSLLLTEQQKLAVKLGLQLHRPILIKGAPGSGKAAIAAAVAHQLGVPHPRAVQIRKATTLSQLLYVYDKEGRLHDSQLSSTTRDASDYITFGCIGQAILESNPIEQIHALLPRSLRYEGPRRSVVLIESIDRADDDFLADLLDVLEGMSFTVVPLGIQVTAEQQLRPVVFLTSDGERPLPLAFTRRVIEIVTTSPTRVELIAIAKHRFGDLDEALVHRAADEVCARHGTPAQFLDIVAAASGLKLNPGDIEWHEMLRAVLGHSDPPSLNERVPDLVRSDRRPNLADSDQEPVTQAPEATPATALQEAVMTNSHKTGRQAVEHETAQESRRLKVFLCHSSADKTAVRQLYLRLQKSSFDPWLDEEDLTTGQDWEEEIKAAVRSSDVVIVCLSKQSITKEGFVQKEIRFALSIADEKPPGTVFIIPARLEDCTTPTDLSRWHRVDLFTHQGYERLVRALNRRLTSVRPHS